MSSNSYIYANGALHIVDLTPHLQSLDLVTAYFSSSDFDMVLSATSGQLAHLGAHLTALMAFSAYGEGQPYFPEHMLRSVSQLHHLRSLHWYASGMTVHIDDVLHFLQACPHLVSFKLGDFKIAYVGFDTPVPPIAYGHDSPSPLVTDPGRGCGWTLL